MRSSFTSAAWIAALCLAACLGGCLERIESITIEPDGTVRIEAVFKTDQPGELYEGDAIPSDAGGWLVDESQEIDDEGKAVLTGPIDQFDPEKLVAAVRACPFVAISTVEEAPRPQANDTSATRSLLPQPSISNGFTAGSPKSIAEVSTSISASGNSSRRLVAGGVGSGSPQPRQRRTRRAGRVAQRA